MSSRAQYSKSDMLLPAYIAANSLAAEAVKGSEEIKLSNEIRSTANVCRAARKASGWFAGHLFLFLCDDLLRSA